MADTELIDCRRIEASEVADAPVVFRTTRDLSMTPEQLFEVLADASAWPKWALAIRKVTWTSPMPIRLGTTRTVEMLGGIVGEEEFTDWDPPRSMAFYFTRTNAPGMEAFAERYDVTPTASGCELTWTMSMWPLGVQRRIVPVLKPVLGLGFSVFLRRLDALGKKRFA